MKKFVFYIIYAIFFIILYQNVLFAQIKAGLHLGMNLANAKYSVSEANVKSKIGFVGGGLLEYKLLDFLFIQPEFSFIQKGITIDPMFDEDTRYQVPDSKENITLNYFQIPLLLKIKFELNSIKPYLFAGPNIGFLLKTEGIKEGPGFNKTVSYKDYYGEGDYAIDFGIGVEYDLSKYTDIFANIRYSLGQSDNLKADDITYNTRGIQLMVGIKICLFNCDSEPDKEDKPENKDDSRDSKILQKAERVKFKEFSFGNYDIPFFVTGYYRPNTTENLDELVDLKKNTLKNANYIESFAKNSSKYKQYKNYAASIDNIFKSVCSTCSDEVFPNFIKASKEEDTLEITVLGYADARPMSGKYIEDESVTFTDKKGRQYLVEKGNSLDNFKLAGLRSYYSGKYLDKMWMECSSDYKDLKSDGKVKFRYISVGVTDYDEEDTLESQRKIKIVISRKTAKKR